MNPPMAAARRAAPLATLAAALLVLAACSPSASTSTTTSAAASAAEADVTVTLSGNRFTAPDADTSGDAPTLTVPAGSSVAFVNGDSHGHTATNGENGTPDANALFNFDLPTQGASGVFTFADAGTFHVTCTIHSSMNLTIVVQ